MDDPRAAGDVPYDASRYKSAAEKATAMQARVLTERGDSPKDVTAQPLPESAASAAGASGDEVKARSLAGRGLPHDSNPIAPGSGFRARDIAAVAYNAVQEYKLQILGEESDPWELLTDKVKQQVTENVNRALRGESVGAATIFAAENQDKGRPEAPWLSQPPQQARKQLLFTQVVIALTRTL